MLNRKMTYKFKLQVISKITEGFLRNKGKMRHIGSMVKTLCD